MCSLDESELKSAILNLLANARDAIPEGGEIIIQATNILVKHDSESINPEITPGEYVKLRVSGSGMNRKSIEKAFDPSFTTRETSVGIGLSLSMIYAFVKRYDGYIHIHSQEKLGTTIMIYFHRAEATQLTKN
ncbi:hypothetical protein MNBD_GAMMA25-2465 [hydrothermal vent metagenome]|uniref:Histidine kinase domain-containing protein n=1 Tax=hydrothermal vent metagenome TaxID=652676 RepID=A0A3B1AXQ0_9ZZZZ